MAILARISHNFNRSRPKSSQMWPQFGEVRLNLAQIGPNWPSSAESCQLQPDLPKLDQVWSTFAQLGPNFANIGPLRPTSSKFGKAWATQFWRETGDARHVGGRDECSWKGTGAGPSCRGATWVRGRTGMGHMGAGTGPRGTWVEPGSIPGLDLWGVEGSILRVDAACPSGLGRSVIGRCSHVVFSDVTAGEEHQVLRSAMLLFVIVPLSYSCRLLRRSHPRGLPLLSRAPGDFGRFRSNLDQAWPTLAEIRTIPTDRCWPQFCPKLGRFQPTSQSWPNSVGFGSTWLNLAHIGPGEASFLVNGPKSAELARVSGK